MFTMFPKRKVLCAIVVLLTVASQALGQVEGGVLADRTSQPAAYAACLPGSDGQQENALAIEWIRSAVEDEIAAWRNYGQTGANESDDEWRRFARYPGGIRLLIEPFQTKSATFAVHVMYRLPGEGWVVREATVFPGEALAVFFRGFSTQGPGTNSGFVCTHGMSNCRIEDVELTDLRRAFCEWWETAFVPDRGVRAGDDVTVKGSRERNSKRQQVVMQLIR